MEVNQDEKEKAGYFNAIDGTRIDLAENELYEYIGVDWVLDSVRRRRNKHGEKEEKGIFFSDVALSALHSIRV